MSLEANYPAGNPAKRKRTGGRQRAGWVDTRQPSVATETTGRKFAASGLLR